MWKTPAALLLATAATALSPTAARADSSTGPEAVEIDSVKDKLKLWSDGHHHFIAAVPFQVSDEHLFWSADGKTFQQLRSGSGGADGDTSWNRTFWEPRVVERYKAMMEGKGGKLTVQCDKRLTELKPIPDGEAKAIVGGARFVKPLWNHRAYALARDEAGVYYYVDKVRDPEEAKSFRLYQGPKGQIKQLKMTNVVSDSEGDIFATKTGKLRLVLDKKESYWVQGAKRRKLVIVPIEDNAQLIYTELGVYTGQPLGTPCDDL